MVASSKDTSKEEEEEANGADEEMVVFGKDKISRKDVSKEEDEPNGADEEMVIFSKDKINRKDEINQEDVSKEEEEDEPNVADEEMVVFGKDEINREDVSKEEEDANRADEEMVVVGKDEITWKDVSKEEETNGANKKATPFGNDESNAFPDQSKNDRDDIEVSMRSKDDVRHTFTRARNNHTLTTDAGKYPEDCYSFLAIHGPREPLFFSFGLLPFVFQLLFLGLLLWSVIDPKNLAIEEVDNPTQGLFIFIPTDASPIVRAAQIVSLLAYVIFPDSSVQDVVKAIQTFPRSSKVKDGDSVRLMRFSCLLRFTQGLFAVFAFLLLVLTSKKVIDIVLNFTAICFISELDDYAFKLCIYGEFGPTLQVESIKIANTKLPLCMYRNNESRHTFNMIGKALVLLTLATAMILVIFGQRSNNFWLTKQLRVQFQEGTGLEEYSGCYDINYDNMSHDRRTYGSINDTIVNKATFGYCKKDGDRKWVLFQDWGDNLDPCDAKDKDRELAHSPKTDTFDVSTSFDESWVSSSGSPLEMYFFESEEKEYYCNLKLGDGVCDDVFNKLEYQYDDGDCCSDTCVGSSCGIGGLKNAFNSNVSGDGFPDCQGPGTVLIAIKLNNITSSRDPELLMLKDDWPDYRPDTEDEWRAESPENLYFSMDCNGKNVFTFYIRMEMVGQNEKIRVRDGANCTLVTRTIPKENIGTQTINDVYSSTDPIWSIDNTITHLYIEEEIEILSMHNKDRERENFKLIPTCYFEKLQDHANFSSIYPAVGPSNEAVDWLVDNEKSSECEDEKFIERYALASMFFTMNLKGELRDEEKHCRWPTITCSGREITKIKLRAKNVITSIPSEIGLLTGLQEIYLFNNDITSIPSEIGLLTGLQELYLSENVITSIPSEIGLLTGLQELDLTGNEITLIPSEIGLMIGLEKLELYYNQITSIPSEIGLLTGLEELYLSGNEITLIPSEIGLLTGLQELELSGNEITLIPSEIGLMIGLEKLELSGNEITLIPSEIGLMIGLEKLELYYNQITSIPSEIGLLTGLEELYLYYNQITSIPSEIGLLTGLQELDLYLNEITSIPSEIGLLTGLEELYLMYNQITSLPSETGLMTGLQTLNLADNQITSLPSEIGLMTGLQTLDLRGNLNETEELCNEPHVFCNDIESESYSESDSESDSDSDSDSDREIEGQQHQP